MSSPKPVARGDLNSELEKLHAIAAKNTSVLGAFRAKMDEIEKVVTHNVSAIAALTSTVTTAVNELQPEVKSNTSAIEQLKRANFDLSKTVSKLSTRLDREEEAFRFTKASAEANSIATTLRIVNPCPLGRWGYIEGDEGTQVPPFILNGVGQSDKVMAYIQTIMRRAETRFSDEEQGDGLFLVRKHLRFSHLHQATISGRKFITNIWSDRNPQGANPDRVPATNIQCTTPRIKRELKELLAVLIDEHKSFMEHNLGDDEDGRVCNARVANGITRDKHLRANMQLVQAVSKTILAQPPTPKDGHPAGGPILFLSSEPQIVKVNGKTALVPKVNVHIRQSNNVRRIVTLAQEHVGSIKMLPNRSTEDQTVRFQTSLTDLADAGSHNVTLTAKALLAKISAAVLFDDETAVKNHSKWLAALEPAMEKLDNEKSTFSASVAKRKAEKKKVARGMKRTTNPTDPGKRAALKPVQPSSPAVNTAREGAGRLQTEMVEAMKATAPASASTVDQCSPIAPLTQRPGGQLGPGRAKPQFMDGPASASTPRGEGQLALWATDPGNATMADIHLDDALLAGVQTNLTKNISPRAGLASEHAKRPVDPNWNENISTPSRKKNNME